MEGVLAVIFILYNLLLLPYHSSFFPLCTDSRAPFTLKSTLKFSSYNGTSYCDSDEDSKLKKQFRAMNISDSSCASLLQSLCAYGPIAYIDLKVPPRPPGYTFIEFEDARDAKEAIRGRDGYDFGGQHLRIELAHGGCGHSSIDCHNSHGGGGDGRERGPSKLVFEVVGNEMADIFTTLLGCFITVLFPSLKTLRKLWKQQRNYLRGNAGRPLPEK